MKLYIFSICILSCLYGNLAQYEGRLPQRPNIPGAVPAPRPLQIPGAIPVNNGQRQGRLLRRPVNTPQSGFYRASPVQNIPPPQQFIATSKPVTEEPEEDNQSYGSTVEDSFEEQIAQKQALLAQLNPGVEFQSTIQQPTTPLPPQFRPEPKLPQRPQPQQPQQQRPQRVQQQQFRPEPQQFRPEPQQFRPEQQQFQPQQRAQRPSQPRPAPQQLPQPQREYQSQRPSGPREKKPVAQILRKYQTENEDGSITWGYENDDGSFKEETIGIDCITRGKYGYVDPDGQRREYNYETGHLCDPVEEEEPAPVAAQGNQQQQQFQKRPRPQ